MGEKLSLTEFADREVKPKCKVCLLPERFEFDKAVCEGISRGTILRWLQRVKGYSGNEVSRNSLSKHFLERHHLGEEA